MDVDYFSLFFILLPPSFSLLSTHSFRLLLIVFVSFFVQWLNLYIPVNRQPLYSPFLWIIGCNTVFHCVMCSRIKGHFHNHIYTNILHSIYAIQCLIYFVIQHFFSLSLSFLGSTLHRVYYVYQWLNNIVRDIWIVWVHMTEVEWTKWKLVIIVCEWNIDSISLSFNKRDS